MSVYVINNMVVRDRDEYMEYVRAFMPVLLKYGGTVVAVQDDPKPLEGSWPYSRTIVLRLPSMERAMQWYESAEYRAIAVHRWNATQSNVVILPAFPVDSSSAARDSSDRCEGRHGAIAA